MITSTQNARLKLVRKLLGRPKERRESGQFVAEGVRLVEEALLSEWPFHFVLTGDTLTSRGLQLIQELESHSIVVEHIPDALMASLSETTSSQGILAVLEQRNLHIPAPLDFVLIADQVRDPGNLGTLLRTAAATGVQAVLLSPETTDAFAPKVLRSGMGAHFHIPIMAMDWEHIRNQVEGLQVFLGESNATVSCWETNFNQPLAMLIGGEAEGASKEARTLATQPVFIPMMGNTESLNAGIAGAILLYEAFRQRINSRGENE